MTDAQDASDLRVLHLVTDRDRRGAQVFATDLAGGLDELGVQGSVVALCPHAHGDGLQIDAAGPTRRSITTLRTVRRLARRHDVVVAHGSTTLFIACVALLGTGVPFVYRQISDPLHWAATPFRRARVAVMIRRAAAVVALSRSSAEVLQRHYRLDARRIAVIGNAVPAERFKAPGPVDVQRARRRLDLRDEDTVLLSLGALVEEKGVDMAIRAAANVGTSLLVVGDGDRRDDLQRLADRLAPDLVRFTGATDRPGDALAAADLLVFPSRGGDSMPATLIEAGLHGLPVIATPVGSITEIVVDNETGRIVPVGDQDALNAALADLLADPERRRSYGRAARRRCLDHLTIEVVAPRWLDLLEATARARTDRAPAADRLPPRS